MGCDSTEPLDSYLSFAAHVEWHLYLSSRIIIRQRDKNRAHFLRLRESAAAASDDDAFFIKHLFLLGSDEAGFVNARRRWLMKAVAYFDEV